jgi:hypothetical protein
MPIIGADSTEGPKRQVTQKIVRSHRMGQRHRLFTGRQHGCDDPVHQRIQILVIFAEIGDEALAAVGGHAPRAALAAPVHGGHGKAAAAQLVYDFEIFLDEFGLAIKQHAGSPRRDVRRGCEPGGAQGGAHGLDRHGFKQSGGGNHDFRIRECP